MPQDICCLLDSVENALSFSREGTQAGQHLTTAGAFLRQLSSQVCFPHTSGLAALGHVPGATQMSTLVVAGGAAATDMFGPDGAARELCLDAG